MSSRQASDSAPIPGIEQLPRSITPARDLWPDIEAGLNQAAPVHATTRRGWGIGAVAASVAVAFLVGILLGRQAPGPAAPALPLDTIAAGTGFQVAAPALAAVLAATEREYQAAWKGFDPAGLAPALLDAASADELARSWQAMNEAEAALLAALDAHPDNPYLAAKLLDLRSQQLGFMRELHMLDQNSRRNT
ncbi:MAG: hypothetical protein AAGH19_10115 [Pseudomonadota bacterium]